MRGRLNPTDHRSKAVHEAQVAKELEGKPRPQTGWINGYCALWLRPGDLHCLAAGEVTASVQTQAHDAVDAYLKEPG